MSSDFLSSRRALGFLAFSLILCASPVVGAQEISVEDAIRVAIENSPALRGAEIGSRSAQLTRERESLRYVPTLAADGGVRAGQTPQQSPIGVVFINTQALTTQGTVSYVSPRGTQMSGGLNLERSVSDSVILGNLGTVWGVGMSLSITQPWLKGFGLEIGRASLRDAELAEAIADMESDRVVRDLTRDVRSAYWQLWYTEREIEIANKALEIANLARRQGQARIDAGLGAGIDLISLETEIASARERILAASTARRARQIELARLLGLDPLDASDLDASDTPPPTRRAPEPGAARALTRDASLDLARMQLERRRAAIVVRQAEDQARARLDTVATLGVRGLGDNPGEALAQFSRFEAVVGYVGMRLDLPLWRDALRLEVERSRLVLERSKENEREVEINLDARVASILADIDAASERAALARRTAGLADQNVQSATARFEIGQATSFEIVQVLQRQREAELRAARARVDLELAHIALDALTDAP